MFTFVQVFIVLNPQIKIKINIKIKKIEYIDRTKQGGIVVNRKFEITFTFPLSTTKILSMHIYCIKLV